MGQVHAQEGQQNLLIKYGGSAAEPYIVQIPPGGKYTVSQTYSWVRDETSRYSLMSYSLDAGASVEIPRKSRGMFSFDVAAGSAHTVTFQTAVQYPLSTSIDSENLLVSFSPASPTGDNWFDTGSKVTITVSNREQSSGSRQQIIGWSLDNPKHVVDGGPSFAAPVIEVAAPHQVKFTSTTQHFVKVISSHGIASGEGWYDEGSAAIVSVQGSDDLLLPRNFAGWDDGTGTIFAENTRSFPVESPKTLTAKWTTDYSRLILLTVLPVAGAMAVVLVKRSGMSKQSQSPGVVAANYAHAPYSASVPQSSEQVKKLGSLEHDNNYSKEISAYSTEKSLEKLQSLQSNGLVSGEKLSKIKQKLEDSLE
jgi:hypothetical protein